MAVYGRDATSLASISNSVTGFGDLQPQFSLRWNAGVHSYMAYITADIPVGAYNSTRLSNIGIGHGAVDVGARLHLPQSADRPRVLRCARFHLQSHQPVDAISERRRHALRLGHLTIPDQAIPRRVWSATSTRRSVATAGRAIGSAASGRKCSASDRRSGSSFRSATCKAILISRAIGEFAAENRPYGWNAWITFAISPADPTPSTPSKRMITK